MVELNPTAQQTTNSTRLRSDKVGEVTTLIFDPTVSCSTCSLKITYRRAFSFTQQDYHSFGILMPGRHGSLVKNTSNSTWSFVSDQQGSYRHGFNGMEWDNDVKGKGNAYDFGARLYDPRLGRWLSIDKKYNLYAHDSPYGYCGNNSIIFKDPDGNKKKLTITIMDKDKGVTTVIELTVSNELKAVPVSVRDEMFGYTLNNTHTEYAWYDINVNATVVIENGERSVTWEEKLGDYRTGTNFKTMWRAQQKIGELGIQGFKAEGGKIFTSKDGTGEGVMPTSVDFKLEPEDLVEIDEVLNAMKLAGGPKGLKGVTDALQLIKTGKDVGLVIGELIDDIEAIEFYRCRGCDGFKRVGTNQTLYPSSSDPVNDTTGHGIRPDNTKNINIDEFHLQDQ